tara:strand:+ start:404 stop:601 length:198 start_codon:yes stop_codon:yes gene_type:complete
MPTGKVTRYIGVGYVIPATVKKPKRKLVALQHFNVLAIKRSLNVNYVDLKHKAKSSWMCILLTET